MRSRLVIAIVFAVAVFAILCVLPAAADDSFWDERFGTPNATDPGLYSTSFYQVCCANVRDVAVYGDNVYVAGRFEWAGGAEVGNVARWDGQQWHSLGGGLAYYVYTLAVAPDGTLYAGGNFDHSGLNGMARWTGSSWVPLGNGVYPSNAASMTFVGNDLWVVGFFHTAGTTSAKGLAIWTGSTWWSPNGGLTDSGNPSGLGYGREIATDGTNVYIVGDFTQAGVVPANNIAQWDGSQFLPLGSGASWTMTQVAVYNGDVIAHGGSGTIGGVDTPAKLARWDGVNWTSMADSAVYTGSPGIDAFAVFDGDLYAGGHFTSINGVPAKHVARWDGIGWHGVSNGPVAGPNGFVFSLAATSERLWIAGSFDNIANMEVGNLSVWDGKTYGGEGMDGGVSVMLVDGNDVYAGGTFNNAGNVPASGLAVLRDGTTWEEVGGGVVGFVYELARVGGDICVAGTMNTAGGVPVGNIAMWDGAAYSALGSGTDNTVNAIAASGADLYAGGRFSLAGGIAAQKVARWDGAQWHPLGSGMNHTVEDLVMHEGELHAAGWFVNAGGVSALRVARWDGAGWHALGPGMNNTVYALADFGGDLYAAGTFTTAGGAPALRLARWDGAAWLPVGGGTNGAVLDLVPATDRLLLAGSFSTAGGVVVQHFAAWDGGGWSPFGSGTDGTVKTIALAADAVYVGGSFNSTGGVAADNVGRWNQAIATGVRETKPPASDLVLHQNYPNPFNPVTTIRFVVPAPGEVTAAVYDVTGRRVKTLVRGWREAGSHDTVWDGTTDGGRAVGSGVYFVRISAAGHSQSRKMLLLK